MTDLYREHDDVDHRFAFHPATSGEKRAEHDSFRGLCRELAHELVDRLPAGRERASALTNLEQVMFWGNAAIARALPVDAPERVDAVPERDRPRCRCVSGRRHVPGGVLCQDKAPLRFRPTRTTEASDHTVSDVPVDDDTLRDLASA